MAPSSAAAAVTVERTTSKGDNETFKTTTRRKKLPAMREQEAMQDGPTQNVVFSLVSKKKQQEQKLAREQSKEQSKAINTAIDTAVDKVADKVIESRRRPDSKEAAEEEEEEESSDDDSDDDDYDDEDDEVASPGGYSLVHGVVWFLLLFAAALVTYEALCCRFAALDLLGRLGYGRERNWEGTAVISYSLKQCESLKTSTNATLRAVEILTRLAKAATEPLALIKRYDEVLLETSDRFHMVRWRGCALKWRRYEQLSTAALSRFASSARPRAYVQWCAQQGAAGPWQSSMLPKEALLVEHTRRVVSAYYDLSDALNETITGSTTVICVVYIAALVVVTVIISATFFSRPAPVKKQEPRPIKEADREKMKQKEELKKNSAALYLGDSKLESMHGIDWSRVDSNPQMAQCLFMLREVEDKHLARREHPRVDQPTNTKALLDKLLQYEKEAKALSESSQEQLKTAPITKVSSSRSHEPPPESDENPPDHDVLLDEEEPPRITRRRTRPSGP